MDAQRKAIRSHKHIKRPKYRQVPADQRNTGDRGGKTKLPQIRNGGEQESALAVVNRRDGEMTLSPCRSGPPRHYLINNLSEFQGRAKLTPGVLVRAVLHPGSPRQKYGRRVLRADCLEIVGHLRDPASVQLIVREDFNLPASFPRDAFKEARQAQPPQLDVDRVDLRHLPLVTIDGEDARDFDDAVYAEQLASSDMRLLVAIADVAHYVPPGSALDREARLRGFSCYLPQAVIPMLPEALSNGLCSLLPHEDRYCVAMDMIINTAGVITSAKLIRGLMASHGRLTYEEVQKIQDGEQIHPLRDHIHDLYAVWERLFATRQKRSGLELELPETVVTCDSAGEPVSCGQRKRLNSHRLIEDCMIAANCAAAEHLGKMSTTQIFRVHDDPSPQALDELGQMVRGLGLSLSRGGNPAAGLQRLIDHARKRDDGDVIQMLVLRACARARYASADPGHFGLALGPYTHFTSPIRRYADLLAHRLLLSAHGLSDETGTQSHHLDVVCDELFEIEQRYQKAERSAKDRLIARLAEHYADQEVSARIEGMVASGLFVCIQDSALQGARGFLHGRTLPEDDWRMSSNRMSLQGRRNRIKLAVGSLISIRLTDINPANGELNCEWLGLKT